MKHKPGFRAVVFDLDGVITQTALVHSRAWKEMFDTYLKDREKRLGEPFRAFSHSDDYLPYVDGKPRYEGVRSFLESRGVILPYGDPSDDVSQETYCGIGNRKNIVFNEILERDGVEVYDSTVALMHRLKQEGIRIGVASSSKNCEMVLKAAGLLDMVETRVDGVVSAELGLKGKPEPDIFTTAADNLGVSCFETVVVEDAISGVQAGRKGNFGLVLGIAREDNSTDLFANGADIVVSDIGELGFEGICRWFEEGLDEDNWVLSYHDYDTGKERSREALMTVGNGYFGTRGAMEEMGINPVNYPGTYLAGGYNRMISRVSGRDVENEDFVNVSNWLPLTFAIDEEDYLDVNKVDILNIKRTLHFKTGVLEKEMVIADAKGRQTRIYSRRFASMKQPKLAALSYTITPLNYSGKISVQSSLTADHINAGVKRYAELNQHHLEPIDQWAQQNYQQLTARATQAGWVITQTARLEASLNGQAIYPGFQSFCRSAVASLTYTVDLQLGDNLTTSKVALLQASHLPFDQGEDPRHLLQAAGSFEALLQESAHAWQPLWEEVDIQLEGDRLSQKLIRLHLYHLLSTCSPHNALIDFSIPARGLSGEAYRGHIFWDELYIMPLYFIHFPEVAKSLLLYRYRRLEQARAYAREFGYKGAMFPWQSGSDGREETQRYHFNPISGQWDDDHSSLQRHVNLAIAYNILMYHHITGDEAFLLDHGAEMLIEICRLWESMTTYDPITRRFSITRVMGPDEFHEHGPGSPHGGLKDNAYTNVMSAWVFKRCLGLLEGLSVEDRVAIQSSTGFCQEEVERWEKLSRGLSLGINDEGIIAQFDGYFDLEEIDWDYYKEKYGNVYRMDRILKAEGKSPDDYKVAKQADTLMLFYNLPSQEVGSLISSMGYGLPHDYIARNMDYYLQRTSHGSTLSRLVHAYLAQQIGRQEFAWEMYRQALGSDYDDIQGGTTAEGIHTGVMAGTVLMVISAFAGLDLHGDMLSFSPSLPSHWRSIRFALSFRGVRYQAELTPSYLNIRANRGTQIKVGGIPRSLEKDEEVKIFFR